MNECNDIRGEEKNGSINFTDHNNCCCYLLVKGTKEVETMGMDATRRRVVVLLSNFFADIELTFCLLLFTIFILSFRPKKKKKSQKEMAKIGGTVY